MRGEDRPLSNEADLIRCQRPGERLAPYVFASPHSGRHYSQEFLGQAQLPERLLRRSEDAYVDLLIEEAPRLGASLVCADFPRSFVDVNRHRKDIDRSMFQDAPAGDRKAETARGRAGLGVVPGIAADGRPIYDRPLEFKEARSRIETFYKPYHGMLQAELQDICAQFGEAILIDCHSMPNASARHVDIVLGDRFGQSCHAGLSALAESSFRASGLKVARNRPYAGGYITEHYGKPDTGIQALQIEINRGLYLNEAQVSPGKDFQIIKEIMTEWMRDMVEAYGKSRLAAE